jgi:RsiW-degrading membrane proteinase PrsW (M82 family)
MILFFLAMVAALPALVFGLWLRRAGSVRAEASRLLACFGIGVIAVALALFLGSALPAGSFGSKAALLYEVFVRTALVEECGRFITFVAVILIARRARRQFDWTKREAIAWGAMAGFGFAALESAFFSLSNVDALLFRALSSVLLHAACSGRIALAVWFAFDAETPYRFRYTAWHVVAPAAIHGMFDFFLTRGGISVWFALALALLTFGRTVTMVRTDDEEET